MFDQTERSARQRGKKLRREGEARNLSQEDRKVTVIMLESDRGGGRAKLGANQQARGTSMRGEGGGKEGEQKFEKKTLRRERKSPSTSRVT
jgi:hypothetical protein